jgi:hypothetical protein
MAKKKPRVRDDGEPFVPYAPRSRTRVAADVLVVVLGTGAAIVVVDWFLGQAALPVIRPVFLGLLHAIAALGILWGLLVRPKRYHRDALGLAVSKATFPQAGIGLVGGALLAGLATAIAVVTKGIEMHRAPSWQGPTTADLVLWVAAALFAAIFEELVFRAGTVGTLRTAFPREVALVVPGAIFALGHLSNPHISPLAIGNTVLAGVWLGLLYLHPKNEPTVPGLGFAVGAHAGWNLALRVLGVPVSGNVAQGRYFQTFPVNELWGGGPYGVEGGLAGTIAFALGAGLLYADVRRRERASSSELTSESTARRRPSQEVTALVLAAADGLARALGDVVAMQIEVARVAAEGPGAFFEAERAFGPIGPVKIGVRGAVVA